MPAALFAAGFAVIVAIMEAVLLQDARRVELVAGASLVAVMCAALALLAFLERLPAHRVDDVVFGSSLLTASVTLWGIHRVEPHAFLTLLIFHVVAVSVLTLSYRHYLVFSLLVLGAFVGIARHDHVAHLPTETLGLVGAMGLGGILVTLRRRSEVRIAEYSIETALRRKELEDALARSRRELEDRTRLEQEREALREQLAHAQRLEAIGALAGGVAHDMNNTLAAILGAAEALVESHDAEAADHAKAIVAAARRGADLTRNLLGYARKGRNQVRPVRLARVVRDVESLLGRSLSRRVRVSSTIRDRTLVVEGDAAQISHALLNLGINAAEALDGVRGEIHLSMQPVELDATAAAATSVAPGPYVEICVEDDGPGIEPTVARRAFEPFFTTKQGGTGLGLSMVWGMAKSHGGAVVIEPGQLHGTRVRLLLPLVAARPQLSEPPAALSTTFQGRRTRALLVDDDAAVRRTTARMLRRLGYQVFEAGDGAEALEVHRREGRMGLAVLDVAMPVMGGAECFERLRALDAALPILLVSGFAPDGEVQRALSLGGGTFLEKPFGTRDLAQAIEVLLEPPARPSETLVVAKLASDPALKKLAAGPFDKAWTGGN
ncbi:MAG: response regulator [Myxococcales bacterium]|nr:response regulator [Myxococcales bacterium]